MDTFQAWVIETRSAATAVNKHKALQQFFKWPVVDEEEIDQSPMLRVRQPKTPKRLIPIIRDERTKRILETCKGKEFVQLRDEAIIRVLYNTGARLSELANLALEDVDLALDSVRYHGKGAKDRWVRLGPKTARALSRYLRARGSHRLRAAPAVVGRARGPAAERQRHQAHAQTARSTGRCRRRARAPVAAHLRARVEAGRGRHRGPMLLLGWTSDGMPRHYGASAAAERAGERVDRGDEPFRDRPKHRGRGDRITQMVMDEPDQRPRMLQRRHVHVAVHPVDALDLQWSHDRPGHQPRCAVASSQGSGWAQAGNGYLPPPSGPSRNTQRVTVSHRPSPSYE